VGPAASLPLRAFFGLRKLAKLRRVVVVVSPFVFNGVVVVATFVVVRCILFRTLDPFKVSEVKVLDYHRFTGSMMGLSYCLENLLFRQLHSDVRQSPLRLAASGISFAHIISSNLNFRLLIVKTFDNSNLFRGFVSLLERDN